jgi:diadenosine tetraphosphate (Ap4A) HIT family hydrolase
MTTPFSSAELFQQEFNDGLHRLADHGGLGPFILACANATAHQQLFIDLKSPLQNQYRELYQTYRNAFINGRDVDVVDEDLLVFLKLHTIGFDSLQLGESRNIGDWKVQFNHIRSFRPRRITQFVHEGVYVPFDADEFNFNKPFMAKECFWSGDFNGRTLDVFYNKYPFAELHCLLVLDKEDCCPQLLTAQDHRYIFNLVTQLGAELDGVGIGYNSYGAYASVNHMHFQMFVDKQRLPVCDPAWEHNGGERAYPALCHVFDSIDASWQCIQQLHDAQQPYNILYMPDTVYIFPRKTQGTVAVPEWSSGFTWYELSGGMIVFNFEDFLRLNASEIELHLTALCPDHWPPV